MSEFEVECYAGYRGDESPRAVVIRGRRYRVKRLLQQWQEPGGRYFKLQLNGGSECVVCHDAATGAWLEIGREMVGHKLTIHG